MRVLAIDTSTARGSIAVASEAGILGEIRWMAGEGHAAWALPAVDFLLQRLALDPRELQGIAVTLGPGSYTGIRVGLSTAQGLALAAGCGCIGVGTLEVLAAGVRDHAASRLVPLVDAYRQEVFGAVYDSDLRPLCEASVGPIGLFLERVDQDAVFAGDGAERFREQIAERFPRARFARHASFLAGILAELACERLASGKATPPETLRAIYLREADLRKKTT